MPRSDVCWATLLGGFFPSSDSGTRLLPPCEAVVFNTVSIVAAESKKMCDYTGGFMVEVQSVSLLGFFFLWFFIRWPMHQKRCYRPLVTSHIVTEYKLNNPIDYHSVKGTNEKYSSHHSLVVLKLSLTVILKDSLPGVKVGYLIYNTWS